MRVDDMSGDTLEYWSDRAATRLAELRTNTPDRKVNVAFEDDAPDPLNCPADTMAVIAGLKVNLTCKYEPGGFMIARRNAWRAQCGHPGLQEISICGDTQAEAVTRLFVAMFVGREVAVTCMGIK